MTIGTAVKFVSIALACSTLAGVAQAEDRACATPTIRFNRAAVAPTLQDWLAQELRAAADKFCDWWGTSFADSFTIDVIESSGPSMALVPAWRGERGRILFPATAVRRR